MKGKTITSVYHIKRMPLVPSKSGVKTGLTLDGHLGCLEFYIQKENPFPLNHLAYYVQHSSQPLKNVVVISNVDVVSSSIPESRDNVIQNVLVEHLENYEIGLGGRTERVARIISSDKKLEDYQLMQMCGLLPKNE